MINIISRRIQKNIENVLFKGKVVIIYGARQVGKTTLVKAIQEKFADEARYFDCDEPDIKQALTDKTSTELKAFLGNKKLIILDEAQRIKNIGLTLKLLADNFPATQIIATGSSSFDLSNEVVEPLTGRKYEFYLHPLSLKELTAFYDQLEINRLLERRIIFGMYPEIVQSEEESENKLKLLARSYLFKDIFRFEGIKNADAIEKLLQALALQIGNEVSYNELGQTVGINKKTVEDYVQILEKVFIVFRLRPFSRNLRNELKKMRKIYFYDTGVRNALINNFNNLDLRTDTGALWENFMINERMKFRHNEEQDANYYFWRVGKEGEVDFLEETGGQLSGFEFKWQQDKFKIPPLFTRTYPASQVRLINRNTYREFAGL